MEIISVDHMLPVQQPAVKSRSYFAARRSHAHIDSGSVLLIILGEVTYVVDERLEHPGVQAQQHSIPTVWWGSRNFSSDWRWILPAGLAVPDLSPPEPRVPRLNIPMTCSRWRCTT